VESLHKFVAKLDFVVSAVALRVGALP
jgi:hypothetical protein